MFGLIELYVLGVGLVAAVVVAVLVVRAPAAPTLRVQRIVRPSTVAGRRAGARRHPGHQRRPPADAAPAAVGARRRQAVARRCSSPPSQPGEAASAAYRVPTTRRGVLVVGPLRAARRDVLGLAPRTFVVAGTDEVLIVPQHVAAAVPRRRIGRDGSASTCG